MTYLKQIENLLDLPPAEKSSVIRELSSHLHDLIDELIASGMDAETAMLEAEKRMGPSKDVAQRLNAEHNTTSWSSSLLTALPFIASFLVCLFAGKWAHHILPVAIVFCTTAYISIRELIRNRRPIWLASWTAAAMVSASEVIYFFAAQTAHAPQKPTMIAMAVSGLGLTIITLATALVMKKHKAVVEILSLVFIITAITLLMNPTDSANIFIVMAVSIVRLSLLLFFAHLIFEVHPYGNFIRSSLFLLSILAFSYTNSLKANDSSIFAILATGIIVLSFTRASTKRLKKFALEAAIIPQAFVMQISVISLSAPGHIILNTFYLLFGTAIYFSLISWIIFWPWKEDGEPAESRMIEN